MVKRDAVQTYVEHVSREDENKRFEEELCADAEVT